jgi:hypothetical protein
VNPEVREPARRAGSNIAAAGLQNRCVRKNAPRGHGAARTPVVSSRAPAARRASEPVQMPNGGVKSEPAYNMDRDGLTLLAMGFGRRQGRAAIFDRRTDQPQPAFVR